MMETSNMTDLSGVIAQRAYELYQLRGGHPGNEFEDWLEAERQVLSAFPEGAAPHAAGDSPAPKPARKRAATAAPRKRTRKKEE